MTSTDKNKVENALKNKTAYEFELTAPSGKHSMAVTACKPLKIGAPATGHSFNLYDLNGGSLEGGDSVAIKGPHGLLLSLKISLSANELVADGNEVSAKQTFTIARADKKSIEIKAGDEIILSQNVGKDSYYLIARNKGGADIFPNTSIAIASSNPYTISALAKPAIPVTAVKANDLAKCNSANKIIDVPGTAYDLELTGPSGKHQLALTACEGTSVKVGAAPTGHTFTLFDFDEGELKDGDKVYIKGPHGLMLGLSKGGDLIASRSATTKSEQFTVKKTADKSKPLVEGETITLVAPGGNLLTALGEGGEKVVAKTKSAGKTEKFKVKTLTRHAPPIIAVSTQDISKCAVSTNDKKAVEAELKKETKKVVYDFELTAPNGTHQLAITSCEGEAVTVGAPEKGRTFSLYDLGGGALAHNDKVVLQGPHGLLLGLTSDGDLIATRKALGTSEQFTIVKSSGSGQIKGGETVILKSSTGKLLAALGKGGQKVVGDKSPAKDTEKFKIKTLNRRLFLVTRQDVGKCAVSTSDKGTVEAALKKQTGSVAYDFELTAPSGTHQLAITSCEDKLITVGAPVKGHTFSLYDLNGGVLEHNDEVAIQGPHGLLLGLTSNGDLIAMRKALGTSEQFTVHKTTSTSQPVKAGDTITLKSSTGKLLTALGKGGQKVGGDTSPAKDTEKFTVKTLAMKAAPGVVVSKQDPGACKSGREFEIAGSPYNLQLTAPNGKDELSLVTCAWVGAPDAEGQTFTLYDLNEGTLKDGDKVVIKTPHGYLLGLENGKLEADHQDLKEAQKFTVKRVDKSKSEVISHGDKIAFLAANKSYVTALGKGGSIVTVGAAELGENEEFRVKTLLTTIALADKQDPKKCTASKKIKVGGSAYEIKLTTKDGDHGLSLSTCAWVGMPDDEGQTFTLYDLNSRKFKYGDKVAIKAPHGFLLGLDKDGALVADKTVLNDTTKFTVRGISKALENKAVTTIVPGDHIAITAPDGTYITTAEAGGQQVIVDDKKKIEADETFGVMVLKKIDEGVKQFAENCKGKGTSYKLSGAIAVPGFDYGIRLKAYEQPAYLGATGCLEVGLGDASKFILYDLNRANLVHGDEVVLKGPNHLLLGLDEDGEFKAERAKFATREVLRIRKVDSQGKPIAGNKGKVVGDDDMVAFLTYDDRYLTAVGDKLVPGKVNKIGTKGKIVAPSVSQRFVVGNLLREESFKKLAKTAGKRLGKMLAKNVIRTVLGPAIAETIIPEETDPNKEPEDNEKLVLGPEACLNNAALVVIPLEDDEKLALAAEEKKQDKDKDSKLKAGAKSVTGAPKSILQSKLMKKLWAKLDKIQSCGGLNFTLTIPNTDLQVKAFYTRKDQYTLPLWHLAFIAGPNTLSRSPLADMPLLKPVVGGLKIDKLLAIVSEDQAKVAYDDLDKDIRNVLKDYQKTTKVSDSYGNTQKSGELATDQKGFVLQQGTNLFGSFKVTSSQSALGALSEVILPGSTKSDEPWRFSAILGGTFIQKLMNKVSSHEKVEADEFENKTGLKLEVWVPSHTPFPFNLVNNKNIFHAEVEKARFVFDLSKNKEHDGTSTLGLALSAQTWNNYYVLGSSAFPIMGKGDFISKSGEAMGKLEGVYEVEASKDPLGKLVPGINLTKLFIGGGIGAKTAGDNATKTLTFSMGSQLTAGKEAVTSTFDIIFEKESDSKVALKEMRISLAGEGEDGRIEIANLGALGKIPMANEFVLEQGVIGITPKESGLPDFYITGGTTWSRTNMGGRIAIMKTTPKGKSKEDLFIFVTANDFSLANLLPDTDAMKTPKSVLTLLKLPKIMLMLATVKGEDVELSVTDFPAPLQPMFEGYTTGEEGLIPIRPDSLSIIAALDFSSDENAIIADGFQKLGFSKFGPTGPLIAAGSIGGLQSGQLTISLGAQLPGYEFPQKVGGVTNPIAQIIKPQGVGFFLDVVVKGVPRVEVGLKGDLRLDLPRLDNFAEKDRQDLNGRIYVKGAASGEIGIFVNGSKAGVWRDPLGLNKNIAIKDTAVLIGVLVDATAAATINIGLGGTLVFTIEDRDGKQQTLEYDGDIIVGGGVSVRPTYVTPSKFGLNLGASRISIDTAVRVADAVLSGMLQSGLINVIIDGDPNNPLAPGLPDGVVKDGINSLRNGLAKQSLPELLHIDEIPLPGLVLKPPHGKDKVRFYIATPGATMPGREETMNGLGFSITGAASMDLLGKNYPIGEVDVTLSAADGLRLYGQVAPIHVGALKLGTKPTKQNPAGGTALDVKASLAETYIMLDGQVELLPLIDDETRIKLSTTNTSFHIKKSIGDDLFNIELDINTSSDPADPKFTVDAAIDNGINKVVEELFTAFGIPAPAIDAVMAQNPLVIESFRLKADLASFAKGTGDDIEVKLQPIYFGERRPLIDASIPPIDWKNPANILLGGQELPNAILGSLIDYMIDHPEKAIKLPNINLGIMALQDAFLGGTKRDQSFESYTNLMKIKKEPKP